MTYKIEKGDIFKCVKTFRMESGEKAYTKGREYYCEIDGNITDNDLDVHHIMEGCEDFFKHFKLIKPSEKIKIVGNKELDNITKYYKKEFSTLKVFESISELSGVPIGEKVYESLGGDYYYGMIIPYEKEEVENSEYFKLIEFSEKEKTDEKY